MSHYTLRPYFSLRFPLLLHVCLLPIVASTGGPFWWRNRLCHENGLIGIVEETFDGLWQVDCYRPLPDESETLGIYRTRIAAQAALEHWALSRQL